MHVVTRKHLGDAATRFKDAAGEIAAWVKIVEDARCENFMQVRQMFKDADSVDEYVIFNIRHSRYRSSRSSTTPGNATANKPKDMYTFDPS